MRRLLAFISLSLREYLADMAQDGDGNVLAVAVALAVVCVIVVGLRFHVRKTRQLGLEIDDWLCLPALVC